MDYYGYSLLFMGFAITLGVGVIALARPPAAPLASALVAGIVTALADFACAAVGHRYDLWHLHGALEVLNVPLSLSVAWVVFTATLLLLFDHFERTWARAALLLVAAAAGALVDDMVFRPGGILTWGRLPAVAIAPYWLSMVALSVVVYRTVLRSITPPEASQAGDAVRDLDVEWQPTGPVSLQRCESYDKELVLEAMKRLLEPLGGMSAFVPPGASVLLKPNYLSYKAPERAVCTHPVVIWAAARLCLDAGAGRVLVGDSPAIGRSRGISKKLGLTALLEGLDVEVVDFTEPVEVKLGTPGSVFKSYQVARQIPEADVIVNLAKVKTHAQMYLTLAVKNCFGAVVGLRKSQWHLMAGKDYDYFGRMLVDLYRLVNPTLNIIDGVVGMEGNGPSAGDPRALGFLGASADGIALDRVVTEIVGADPTAVPTLRVVGAIVPLTAIELHGPGPDSFAVHDFKPARQARADMSSWLGRFGRNAVSPKPVIDHSLCTRCKQCAKHCPPDVMKLAPRPGRAASGPQDSAELMTIDLEGCIRCFCCQEICPEEAITVQEGWMARLGLVR
ncbi:MAG: DUF362 domain-containing protein [bacterium]